MGEHILVVVRLAILLMHPLQVDLEQLRRGETCETYLAIANGNQVLVGQLLLGPQTGNLQLRGLAILQLQQGDVIVRAAVSVARMHKDTAYLVLLTHAHRQIIAAETHHCGVLSPEVDAVGRSQYKEGRYECAAAAIEVTPVEEGGPTQGGHEGELAVFCLLAAHNGYAKDLGFLASCNKNSKWHRTRKQDQRTYLVRSVVQPPQVAVLDAPLW